MKKVFVVAGVIINEKKILCAQRSKNNLNYISKKFEFPGGKIEKFETDEQCLKREILEELSLEIEINDFYMLVNHIYPDFKLNMKVYLCSSKNRNVILKEHISCKWLSLKQISNLDWAEADLPVVRKLLIDKII